MKSETSKLEALNSAFIAFLPFGTLVVYFFWESIPFRWASLASLLRTVSFVSFYSNLRVNDILWSVFSLYAFILVSLPVYFNTVNVITDHDIACEQRTQPDKVVFSELFKTVYNGVFSDYKISLLSKTPLVIQVLAGGSVLYSIFGLDWVMHSLAGFGIGAVSLKAYKTAVNTYSYSKLASYFGLDKFESFKTERKWATAEWTIFCLVIVTVSWELVERIIYFIQPTNVFRIGLEFVGNSFGDVVFGILGGMIAWQLIENKLHWD